MEIILLIIIGIISRIVPHLPNMTAVGGISLFTSARFGVKKAVIVTSVVMMATDVFIGFHAVMWATYGCFLFTILLGQALRNRKDLKAILSLTLLSSIVFYLVTNFAVWVIPGSMYPKTIAGLFESYINALPFFRNSLVGDLTFSSLFFAAYELVSLKGLMKSRLLTVSVIRKVIKDIHYA